MQKNYSFILLLLILSFYSCDFKDNKSISVLTDTINGYINNENGEISLICEDSVYNFTSCDSSVIKKIIIGNYVQAEIITEGDDNIKLKSIKNFDDEKTKAYTSLLGRWTMTDPIDSTQRMGINILPFGDASSINMGKFRYDSWYFDENSKYDTATIIIKSFSESVQNSTRTDTATVVLNSQIKTFTINNSAVVYTKE